MKKLATLLTAALFSLTVAAPASAAPADDSLAIVPAAAPAKPAKAQKHKKVKKAKHKPARIHKHRK